MEPSRVVRVCALDPKECADTLLDEIDRELLDHEPDEIAEILEIAVRYRVIEPIAVPQPGPLPDMGDVQRTHKDFGPKPKRSHDEY